MRVSSASNTSGFTLIELMIVIAILGILMAVAVGTYREYTVRAKVSEGISMVTGLKTAVSETANALGTFPVSNSSAGMAAPTDIVGDNVLSVGTGATDGGGDGLILVTYRGDPNIDARTLEFSASTSAGSIAWNCGTNHGLGTTVASRFLPSSCRD